MNPFKPGKGQESKPEQKHGAKEEPKAAENPSPVVRAEIVDETNTAPLSRPPPVTGPPPPHVTAKPVPETTVVRPPPPKPCEVHTWHQDYVNHARQYCHQCGVDRWPAK